MAGVPKRMPLVTMGFSFTDSDLDLDLAIFPIHAQERQRCTFDRGRLIELQNFALVQEQTAWARRPSWTVRCVLCMNTLT
jgi:hypothetical protein